MIDCEYYSLNEASDILSLKKNMLVHFGATGKIPIYMLAAGIPIEIVQIEEGGREVFIEALYAIRTANPRGYPARVSTVLCPGFWHCG